MLASGSTILGSRNLPTLSGKILDVRGHSQRRRRVGYSRARKFDWTSEKSGHRLELHCCQNVVEPQTCSSGGGNGGGNHIGWIHGGGNGDDEGGNQRSPIFFPMVFIGLADSSGDNKKKKIQAPVTLTLCSFAVTRMAYSRITRLFKKYYKKQTGRDVRFRLSFGGSGVQARAVIDGLPADIVALALPLDVIKIEQAGLIRSDWKQRVKNKGVVAESVVAIVVREGNPKNIQDWDDLIRDDVKVITSNPKTAGGARWNFLAMWGHKMGKSKAAAKQYVTDVFRNVPVQPRDSREASDVFYKQKVGDALLTYENEVCMTNEMVGGKEALPYVVPRKNIRIEAPVAIIDRNIDKRPEDVREAAEAFVDYLFTEEAQREFVNCGFRAVIPSIAKESSSKYPKVKTLWNVDKKLGGWIKSQETFFDSGKILDQIQKVVGEEKVAEAQLN